MAKEFSYDGCSFRLDGKRHFVYSGEVHYFRIARGRWALHLRKLKAAGLNTVSSYVPWCWHEFKEGSFDFSGRTNPSRDLVGFIKLASSFGLNVILKPGPVILAEYLHHGLPEWLLRDYPDIILKNQHGKPSAIEAITLMHPTFLKFVKSWYRKVLPIISRYQVSNKGGCIVMLQVCNEVGILPWLAKEADFSPTATRYFRRYLKEKHGTNKGFSLPKINTKARSLIDVLKIRDYQDFTRWYYGLYLSHLSKLIVDAGIDVPLYHNLPGWMFGRAAEFPENAVMYDEAPHLDPQIILGVDNIPEDVSYRNFYDDLVCNEVSYAVQGRTAPIFVAEQQAGTREDAVETYPNELELFYKASLAHGVKGMNLYMFSQGANPDRQGAFGPMFYWRTPLNNDGSATQLYPVVKKIGNLIKQNEERILNAERRATLGVTLYKPYYQTELLRLADLEGCGLRHNPKLASNFIYFNGLLKASQLLNIDFDMHDLELANVDELLRYKQLWAFCLDFMDEESQRKLLEYAECGGHLIVFPMLPRLDLRMRRCTILMDELAIKEEGVASFVFPKIDLLGMRDIHTANPITLFKRNSQLTAHNSKLIATLPDGRCCGLMKRFGKGSVLVLGAGIGHEIREHIEAYKKLFLLDGIKPNAYSDNENIVVTERFGKDYAMLFIANYHRVPKQGKVFYLDPITNKRRIYPARGNLKLNPTEAILAFIDKQGIRVY